MVHFLYILFSPSKNTHYIGETYNLNERLAKHDNHQYKGSFTKIANDWELVLHLKCHSKDDAIYLEKFIKRMKSKKFILKIIDNPNILTDILNKK